MHPVCTYNPKIGYLNDETKIFEENKSFSELLLTTKYIAEGNVPCFPSPGLSQLQNLSKKG